MTDWTAEDEAVIERSLTRELTAAEQAQRRLEGLTDAALWQQLLELLPDDIREGLRAAKDAYIATTLASEERFVALRQQAQVSTDSASYAQLKAGYEWQDAEAAKAFALYSDVAAGVRGIIASALERHWKRSTPELEAARKKTARLRNDLETFELLRMLELMEGGR